jgi:uncharacterized protein YchJ
MMRRQRHAAYIIENTALLMSKGSPEGTALIRITQVSDGVSGTVQLKLPLPAGRLSMVCQDERLSVENMKGVRSEYR